MRYFVTLFDSYYLPKGLAMLDSLNEHSSDHRTYVICFDSLCFEVLASLRLPNVTPVSLEQFETPELLKTKSDRTRAEYCWTCTPETFRYVFRLHPNATDVTYLDADLMFFSSPESVFSQFEKYSVLLTPHRYAPAYDQTETSGVYCVQFVTFRNDAEGKRALNWWADRCLEWCYHRAEDGKLGDQKYLDDWTTRFKNVLSLEHKGAGVAPWNVSRYRLSERVGRLYVDEEPAVFFHYHRLRTYSHAVDLCENYPLSRRVISYFYKPYLHRIERAIEQLLPWKGRHRFGIEPLRLDSGLRLLRKSVRRQSTVRIR